MATLRRPVAPQLPLPPPKMEVLELPLEQFLRHVDGLRRVGSSKSGAAALSLDYGRMDRFPRSRAAVPALEQPRRVDVPAAVLVSVQRFVDVGQFSRVAVQCRVDVSRLVGTLPAVALGLHVGRVQLRLVTGECVRKAI